MKPIPLRVQLGLVAAVYALVLVAATAMVFARHLMYVYHPQDAAAAGGMYAAGDLFLGMMIGCMLLVPTFFLVLVIRNSESLYTGYAKILVGLSLTAPLCLGVISIPAVNQGTMLLGWICMDRLFGSPIVIVGLVVSWFLARFDRAKRLTLYALLIEVLTLVVIIALFLFPGESKARIVIRESLHKSQQDAQKAILHRAFLCKAGWGGTPSSDRGGARRNLRLIASVRLQSRWRNFNCCTTRVFPVPAGLE
jgi:hypothetical protein